MHQEALISIVIPVYNKENSVRRCLESLRAQSYKNIQIIVVDDGSIDDSLVVCEELEKYDERIVVIHKENGGVSSARNAGLDAVQGEYLLFVDADDYVKEDYVEKLYETLIANGADVVECGAQIVDEIEGSSSYRGPKFSVMDNSETIIKNFCRNEGMTDFLWDKIYRTDIFKGLRFKKWRCSEDFELLARLAVKINKVVAIDEPLYVYVRETGSVGKESFSEKKIDVIKAREEVMEYYASIGETNLTYIIAVQILSHIYVLYEQLMNVKTEEASNYRSDLIKYFEKYYSLARKERHSFVKDTWRFLKFNLFRVSPVLAVKVFMK